MLLILEWQLNPLLCRHVYVGESWYHSYRAPEIPSPTNGGTYIKWYFGLVFVWSEESEKQRLYLSVVWPQQGTLGQNSWKIKHDSLWEILTKVVQRDVELLYVDEHGSFWNPDHLFITWDTQSQKRGKKIKEVYSLGAGGGRGEPYMSSF